MLEVGRYETVCHTGTSLDGYKSYRHFRPEKYHTGTPQWAEQLIEITCTLTGGSFVSHVTLYTYAWLAHLVHQNLPKHAVFSERELTFTLAMLSPVRLSVVCNVGAPYSAGWNIPQFFFGVSYLGHPLTSTENFTENPSIWEGWLNARRVAKYSDFSPLEWCFSNTVQDRR